jgi:preprotein translocase subunit SecE
LRQVVWPPLTATLRASTVVATTTTLVAVGVAASGFGFERAISHIIA